jgi:hypothetical protein
MSRDLSKNGVPREAVPTGPGRVTESEVAGVSNMSRLLGRGENQWRTSTRSTLRGDAQPDILPEIFQLQILAKTSHDGDGANRRTPVAPEPDIAVSVDGTMIQRGAGRPAHEGNAGKTCLPGGCDGHGMT